MTTSSVYKHLAALQNTNKNIQINIIVRDRDTVNKIEGGI